MGITTPNTRARLPRRLRIWRQILFWGFLAQIPIGYSVAFAYDTALWAWHRTRMATELWGTAEVPAVAEPVVAQLCAMLGATMACWGVAMAWVSAGPFLRRERWAWWCILSSLLAWGLVDTALSAVHGVWINVVFNIIPLVMVGLPLAMTRSAFTTPDAIHHG